MLLSLTEFWIVHALARHPGHVSNRQQLMDAANVVLDDNTITSHVKRIRRKFQAIDPKFDARADRLRHGLPLGRIAHEPRMSLRLKLLLLGLATLVLPWAGCRYAREMESALRQGESEFAAGAVADHRHLAAGAHRPAVPRDPAARAAATDAPRRGSRRAQRAARPPTDPDFFKPTPYDLEPLALTAAPLLDGYADDWPREAAAWTHFDQDEHHRFAMLTGVHERMLYVLLEVHDEHPLFDAAGSNSLDPATFGDRVWLGFEDRRGEQHQVFLAATGPGPVTRAAHRDRRIRPAERAHRAAHPRRLAADGRTATASSCGCRCR